MQQEKAKETNLTKGHSGILGSGTCISSDWSFFTDFVKKCDMAAIRNLSSDANNYFAVHQIYNLQVLPVLVLLSS